MPQFSYLLFFGLVIKTEYGQHRSCQWITSARCEGDYILYPVFPTLLEAFSFFYSSSVFLFFICSKQPQQLDEVIKIPKETIEILKNQVFGFDTFFVTSQDPYEVCSYLSSISFCICTKVLLHEDQVLLFCQGGVLFKGNLRGQAAKSYDKISKRLQVCHIFCFFSQVYL